MIHLSNLYEVTRNSIERNYRCGCNTPFGLEAGSGYVRLCQYHEGMEDGIDIDRNQYIMKIVESLYDEGVIDKSARQTFIRELEDVDN